MDVMFLRLVAVSSRHDPFTGDEGAATEMVASVERHLVRHAVSFALMTSDNLIVLTPCRGSS